MSTDDSVSEDVSSSGPRSHCRPSGEGGKGSEASPLSSEATTASGLGASEGICSASQTTGGTVASQTVKSTPAHNKIRGLCLNTEEDAFTPGKNLPFINPSSLETLRALVEEIRSGGETDPQVWKDCEDRWLHLFQLVEKQYQEQILAQQEQYQCQIQLIQDEIKALVQLQNRPPQADFNHGAAIQASEDTTTSKDFLLPLTPGDCSFPAHAPSDSDSLAAPAALSPFSSPSPPHRSDGAVPPADERAATGLSSGYGTLSAWETGEMREHRWLEDADAAAITRDGAEAHGQEESSGAHQQKTSGQVLTSWALRQKLRAKKIKTPASRIPEYQELPRSTGHSGPAPPESADFQRPAAASSSCASFSLRRSDSLLSEASGLTYWRLNECDLYHRLPDALEHGSGGAAYFLREPSADQAEDPGVSLREIYQHKHMTDVKRSDWERSGASTPFSLQPVPAGASQPSSTTPVSLDGASDASQEVPSTPRTKTGEEEATNTRSSTLRPVSGSLEDPVVLSLLRQNLREKHSRHVADLKAYYECEIQVLRDKLELRHLPGDLERSNRVLSDRCQHLEKALAETGRRIAQLEETNVTLAKQLAEWPERYAVAGATVKSLRQRLEDSKRSAREKAAAALKARRQADDCEARRDREAQAKKELLAKYDGVLKDNDRLKLNLLSTEDKLYQANDVISDLKRTISKLESQVRQLEHENQARLRHAPHAASQPSGAGLFHHPDPLHSPGRGNTEPDAAHRRSPPRPDVRQAAAATKSAFPSETPTRCTSSRDPDRTSPPSRRREEGAGLLTPIMRALIELEETRATESRAPWLANHRPSFGGAGAPLRSQRSLSPDGHRSSSLPPPGLRSNIATTPTKREMLLAPLPTKGSPKRCPTENYSTAFGHRMPREEHLSNRCDAHADHTRRHSFHSSSPRKKLHFGSADHQDAAVGSAPPDGGDAQLTREGGGGCPGGCPASDNKVQSLAEAERLLDELTREKLEIEACLSRMPPSSSGGRVSVKTRLDQVALEERLEHLNRDLGSIRMTLKRFRVLRSSASIA
ncbi:M-phase phosphoprotein 9 [Syngnathoides biaculeatus]|uniref:M-phase phosphoprotein 9 n=1 Tax=Syngnathoides biaculeatus TaxID=300417 RepID=UPI002ADE93E6|nr:M-phase phosphoprotein 9 [Syngnathoides biaculeatus]